MDKTIVDNFSRSSGRYDQFADIQKLLQDDLIDWIKKDGISYQQILDIGCGTGRLISDLAKDFPLAQVFGLDISFAMARISRAKTSSCVVADAGQLPFHSGSFDLIVSNAAYQWVGDLEKAFHQAYCLLKPGGFFFFNCFTDKTLEGLRKCFKIETNSLPDKELIISSLSRSGFNSWEIKEKSLNKNFSDLYAILSWLKNIGANRLAAKPLFLTPARLAMHNDVYCRQHRIDKEVYANFEIIMVKAERKIGTDTFSRTKSICP